MRVRPDNFSLVPVMPFDPMKRNSTAWLWFWLALLGSCGTATDSPLQTKTSLSWQEMEKQSRGKTVQLMMWQGDPQINRYMTNYVVPGVKKKYGIELEVSGGQGNAIVSAVMSEKEAGKKTGVVDLCWINGETFYQLRQLDGLFGPFVQRLPNAHAINFANPFIKFDFQKPVEGMECPWGNVQFCLIYNSDQIKTPPRTTQELESFVQAHPGRFTIGTDFTGLTFLKSLLIDFAGGHDALAGNFDEAKYNKSSAMLWAYINRIKPFFWKEGKTFPAAVAPMHQLFAQGELWFTMSNNDGEVDAKVAEGVFPTYARGYVLDGGTIQNSHYLGILKNSPQPVAAMLVINFMISPAAQLEKQRPSVWGDGTVLQMDSLPTSYKVAFDSLAIRKYGPARKDIQSKALRELDPEYMIRLNDDFRKFVIEK